MPGVFSCQVVALTLYIFLDYGANITDPVAVDQLLNPYIQRFFRDMEQLLSFRRYFAHTHAES